MSLLRALRALRAPRAIIRRPGRPPSASHVATTRRDWRVRPYSSRSLNDRLMVRWPLFTNSVLPETAAIATTRFDAQLGLRDLDDLVALALVEFRQVGQRECEQVAGTGDGDDAVGLWVSGGGRLQDFRTGRQVQHHLAGFLASGQVLEAGDETIAWMTPARSAGHCRRWRGATNDAPGAGEKRPVSGSPLPRARKAGCASLWNSCGLPNPGNATCCVLRPRTAASRPSPSRYDMPAASRRGPWPADPAFFRQHHGHRFAGDEFGFVQRLRGLACDQG